MNFPIGTRVVNRDGEIGTVVQRSPNTPPEATPVMYDGDPYAVIWNTVTTKLRLVALLVRQDGT